MKTLLLAAVTAAVLVACSSGPPEPAAQPPQADAPSPTPTQTLRAWLYDAASSLRALEAAGIKAERLGYRVDDRKLRNACQGVLDEIPAVFEMFPVPDPDLDSQLVDVLQDYKDAATDCAATAQFEPGEYMDVSRAMDYAHASFNDFVTDVDDASRPE